jgi:beta-lactamase class A
MEHRLKKQKIFPALLHTSNKKSKTRTARHISRTAGYYSNANFQRELAQSRPEIKSSKRRPGKLRVLLIVTMLFLMAAGHLLWTQHVSAQTAARQAQAAVAARKAEIFAGQVGALLAANPDLTISVSTISPTNGLQQYGSNGTFDAASTAKLLTATDFLSHVEQHTASLNQAIDGQNAEYLLRIMLVNSDDSAWADLNDYLGHDDLEHYASGLGITDYDADDNTLSSNDIAVLLNKLYDRQLLNAADRSLVLNYMSQANYRNFIVAAVPSGDTVYHKVGEDVDNVHDAAIISNGEQSFVLVIFTNGNGTYNWDARAQLMQAITQDAISAYL